MICTVEGCNKTAVCKAKNPRPTTKILCIRHLKRWQKYGVVVFEISCKICGQIIPDEKKLPMAKYCSEKCRFIAGTQKTARHRDRNKDNPEWLAARAAQMKVWRDLHPKEHSAIRRRAHLRNCYGLSESVFDLMVQSQNGLCAICRREPENGQFHVDHNHACCPGTKRSCGKCIRGLLCPPCNRALGFFRDDILTLRAAIQYLLQANKAFENRHAA